MIKEKLLELSKKILAEDYQRNMEKLEEILLSAEKCQKAKEKELKRLRGLIGYSCAECAHKAFCKNRETYDESWMLGCRDFRQYFKRTSEDFDRIIGDTRFVLHGYEFVRREAD